MRIERDAPLDALEPNGLFATHQWQVADLAKLETSIAGAWCTVTARNDEGSLVGFVQAISDGIRHVYVLRMLVHPGKRRLLCAVRVSHRVQGVEGNVHPMNSWYDEVPEQKGGRW